MKLINEKLKDLRGNEFKGGVTLFQAIELALVSCDEQTPTEKKRSNYKLVKRFIDTDEANVEIEELAEIKSAVGQYLVTEVMGVVEDILEK